MLYHISIDTNRYARPEMFDSRTKITTHISHNGARSFLEEYINRLNLQPISIHESHLPDRNQLVCWYTMGAPISRPAETESIV